MGTRYIVCDNETAVRMAANESRGRPTLQDVARLAGVSHQTVSRVINDYPHIRPEMRDRVQRAIDQLEYRRNTLARNLARHRSDTIGVVVAELTQVGPAAALGGVERAAREAGYGVVVVGLPGPGAEGMREALTVLAEQTVDGVVVVAPEDVEARAVRLAWRGAPIVTVTPSAEHDGSDISVDTREGARMAVRHLAQLGHRQIRHLAGPHGYYVSELRRAGWEDELAAHGLPVVAPVVTTDWSPRAGYESGRQLLEDGAMTAVFAANDQLAQGLLLALHEAGRPVPAEVSVVGYDDDPAAGFTIPPLTTVHQDFPELGRLAIERLLQLRGESAPRGLEHGALQELVVRLSTSVPRH
jgi:DNA-binding LacI/PurR family transcriptional regulator